MRRRASNRRGTLTDAQTLRLYERGTPLIALCLKEGMTPYGILTRCSRERDRRRRRGALIRRKAPQQTYTRVLDLVEAMNELSATLERLYPSLRAEPNLTIDELTEAHHAA